MVWVIHFFIYQKIRNVRCWRAKEPWFASGLGHGISNNFLHISKERQERIFERAQKDIQFSIGLGEGLGEIIMYSHDYKQRIMEVLNTETGLSRGIGIGLGKVYQYLEPEFQEEVFEIAEKNSQFSIGLGMGLAGHSSVSIYHSRERL